MNNILVMVLLYATASFQLNALFMFSILRHRNYQLLHNKRLIIASRKYFIRKRLLAKRVARECWTKKGRTDAWCMKFMDNEVELSDWKENFRMTRESFFEFCTSLRPYLTKQTTRIRKPI